MLKTPVDYRNEDGIVTITLNMPEQRNGLSPDMVEAVVAALEQLNREPDVRCAVLTGEGTAFSAGGNPKRMLQPDLYPNMSTAQLRRFYKEGIQRLPMAFTRLDVPIIAAVNGPAIGAGCDLACLCDIRLASQDAVFAESFVKFGIIPGDGGAWLLPRIIGLEHANRMLLSGDAVDATESLRIGLVSLVVAPETLLSEAHILAARIASNPPHAVQFTKRLIAESQQVGLPAALEYAASMQAMSHKMEDHREAVTAFIEKRSPEFKGE